jgi:hypothetical protein
MVIAMENHRFGAARRREVVAVNRRDPWAMASTSKLFTPARGNNKKVRE